MRNGNITSSGASLWVQVTLSVLMIMPYLSGCAAFVAVGAGAGAYSYISGNVLRTYDADYYQTIRASRKAMNNHKITLVSEKSDGITTEMIGRRGDDTPVTIRITYLNSLQTEVGIRTGVVGVTETEVSEKVHNSIANGLTQYSRSVKTLSPTATKKSIPENQLDAKLKPTAASSRPGQDLSLPDKNLNYTRSSQSSVYLYYAKSELAIPPGEYETLDRVVDFLLSTPDSKLEIFGYTDSTGDNSTNLSNSIHRVKAIKNYLIAKGLEEERISAQGFGATNFLESNKNKQLRKMNRRVELHIR